MTEHDELPHRWGILIVDDDASLATTLQDFLRQEGYSVEIALSAAEALAVHERNPHIAVALIDLIMPGTDGLTLLSELQRRNPDLAVVIMTGYGTIETAVEAVKRGAEDYVTKPFERQVIRKKIGAAHGGLRAAGPRDAARGEPRALAQLRVDRDGLAPDGARD